MHKNNRHRVFELTDTIISQYINGRSARAIAISINCRPRALLKALRKHGIVIRDRSAKLYSNDTPPTCKAPVPGGCDKICAKYDKIHFRSLCSAHQARRNRQRPINTPIEDFDKIVLSLTVIAKYLEGASPTLLAEELGLSAVTISAALKRRGIK